MYPHVTAALTFNQIDDYATVAMIIVAVYDYVLTFSKEIDYVWCRPWTWVSTLFVIIRYLGLCWVIAYALSGTGLLPGPVKAPSFTTLSTWIRYGCYFEGTALWLIDVWGYVLFLAAADLVMILRVYAMWDKSRTILSILLFLYMVQIIVICVWDGVYYSYDETSSVTIQHTAVSTFCNAYTATPPGKYELISQIVLGVTQLILAVIPTFKQAVEMYRLTKHWEINRYMKLFTREGVLYFVLNLLANTLDMIRPGSPRLAYFLDVLICLSNSISYLIMPRFIINIRELYDRDLRNRWQGIDTGFGVISQAISSGNEAISTIVFADVRPEEVQATECNADDSEVIQLEGVGHGTPQV